MKTTTNNRKFLKLFFLAIGLCTFNGMKAQDIWSYSGDKVYTIYKDLTVNSDPKNGERSSLRLESVNGYWSIFGSDYHLGVYNYNPLKPSIAANPLFISKSSSNVCIGCDITTVPTQKLHVDGNVRAGNALIGGPDDFALFGNNAALIMPGGSIANYALMQGPAGNTFLNAPLGAAVNLRINNVDQAIISDTKINFLNNIGIGIGTAKPSHNLQVAGIVRAGNAIIGSKQDGNAYFGSMEMDETLYRTYALMQGPSGGTFLNSSGNTAVSVRVGNLDQMTVTQTKTDILNSLTVTGGGGVNHIKNQTSFGAELMPLGSGATVSIDGRLIISDFNAPINNLTNTVSDNYKDYLLWVQEGIVATDFAITTLSQWPDYVFNKEYKLNSLNEVASFIKTNGHLPTMPSAKEIEKNGFTLSDMTQRTVKTIEELTLHTIEQQKLIENQSQLIESLAKRLQVLEAKQ